MPSDRRRSAQSCGLAQSDGMRGMPVDGYHRLRPGDRGEIAERIEITQYEYLTG
ncbi:MAG: hypothetical protein HQ481_10625 [Alphaproteobacteria bacterium]|nr:hypothetical protein [Alphaproteobacteria bacterium]